MYGSNCPMVLCTLGLFSVARESMKEMSDGETKDENRNSVIIVKNAATSPRTCLISFPPSYFGGKTRRGLVFAASPKSLRPRNDNSRTRFSSLVRVVVLVIRTLRCGQISLIFCSYSPSLQALAVRFSGLPPSLPQLVAAA